MIALGIAALALLRLVDRALCWLLRPSRAEKWTGGGW